MIEKTEELYCANHPQTPTSLRCNRCEKPICPKCAVKTPIGYRCKECVRGQQKIFDTAQWYDYPLAFLDNRNPDVFGIADCRSSWLLHDFVSACCWAGHRRSFQIGSSVAAGPGWLTAYSNVMAVIIGCLPGILSMESMSNAHCIF
jgi:hypothetical protein